ncbi:hypothetical protein LINGRAHAP2_LOCUS22841 [Linum grandiflorum]
MNFEEVDGVSAPYEFDTGIMGHSGAKLGTQGRHRSSFRSDLGSSPLFKDNSSPGSPNEAKSVALESVWNYLQLS